MSLNCNATIYNPRMTEPFMARTHHSTWGRLKWIIMESNNKSRQLYCKLKDSNAVNPTWADNNPPCLSGYKNWELYTHKHDNMSRYTNWELYTRKHDNMSFKINMSIQKESRTSQNIVSFSRIYIGSVW